MLQSLRVSDKYERVIGALFLISAVIGPGLSFSKIYFFHFSLLIFASYTVLNNRLRSELKQLFSNTYNHFFFALLGVLVLSLFWCVNLKAGIIYIFQFLLGFSVVLGVQLLIKNKNDLWFYFKSLGYTFVVIMGAIGFLEIFTDFRWPISVYSDYIQFFHRKNLIFHLRIIEVIKGYSDSCPTVFSYNANNFALLIGVIMPFFQRWNLKNIIISILAFVLLIYTGSKIIIILSILIPIFLSFRFQKQAYFGLLFLLLLVTPIITAPTSIMAVKANETFAMVFRFNLRGVFLSDKDILLDEERIGKSGLNSSSGAARTILSIKCLKELKNSYGLGVGAGSITVLNETVKSETMGVTSPHNYWFEITANGGIIAGLLYFLLIIKIAFTLFKKREITDYNRLLQSFSIMVLGVIALSSAHYYLPMYLLFGLMITILTKNIKIAAK